MSRRSARSIRNFSLELSQDLVLPNVDQVHFHPPPWPQARQGVFDPPVLFSDVLRSCFLVLKGAHSPEDGFPRVARAPLLARFLGIFFQTSFLRPNL